VPEWRSCFWHSRLKLFLVVYVDDFKMSGPEGNLREGWQLIRSHLTLEDPTPSGKYLGCEHRVFESTVPAEGNFLHGLASQGASPVRGASPAATAATVPVRVVEYDMSSFLQQCVARYLELANLEANKLRKAATPFLELDEDPVEQGGTLQPIASKVLMKILYAARMARHDLLCATCRLASKVTKWTTACDKQLHRLVSYINTTLDVRSFTWVGNRPKDMNIVLYSDADFAGCKETLRSTTGVFLTIQGTHTFAPLAAVSKKQTCVSHSTPEAELVAADHAVRAEGLPALPLWELILGRKLQVHLKEDNEAAIKNLLSGKNPNMRHMGRTHKVDFMWLHETVSNKTVTVEYTETDVMAADIFTKSFSNSAKWESLLPLIGHLDKGTFVTMPGKRGETPSTGMRGETPSRRETSSRMAKAMSSSLDHPPDRRIVEY